MEVLKWQHVGLTPRRSPLIIDGVSNASNRFCLRLIAAPAFADEKAKPNTLTPKEIADGWILLFDGETTFGWKVEGEAKVKDGILHLGRQRSASIGITVIWRGAL